MQPGNKIFTIDATWSFLALPEPVTDCLTLVGEYSWTGISFIEHAVIAVPLAIPSFKEDCPFILTKTSSIAATEGWYSLIIETKPWWIPFNLSESVNEILGVHHKIVSGFPAGYGFTGIAVALMGRNHPIGIFPAAFLFGILYQGGSEVTFDMPNISRYMFVAVQGVIILFSGALENLFRPQIESFFVNKLNIRKEV